MLYKNKAKNKKMEIILKIIIVIKHKMIKINKMPMKLIQNQKTLN